MPSQGLARAAEHSLSLTASLHGRSVAPAPRQGPFFLHALHYSLLSSLAKHPSWAVAGYTVKGEEALPSAPTTRFTPCPKWVYMGWKSLIRPLRGGDILVARGCLSKSPCSSPLALLLAAALFSAQRLIACNLNVLAHAIALALALWRLEANRCVGSVLAATGPSTTDTPIHLRLGAHRGLQKAAQGSRHPSGGDSVRTVSLQLGICAV